MMTSFLILFFSIMMFFSLNSVDNPLNLSMKLVLLTSLLFCYLTIQTFSWFPMILIMLILGGILVIFSILSSLMPNEKMKKEKMKMILVSILMSIFFFNSKESSLGVFKANKSFIEELPVFIMIMSLMLFYFFSFICVLNLEETPMRKFSCF